MYNGSTNVLDAKEKYQFLLFRCETLKRKCLGKMKPVFSSKKCKIVYEAFGLINYA